MATPSRSGNASDALSEGVNCNDRFTKLLLLLMLLMLSASVTNELTCKQKMNCLPALALVDNNKNAVSVKNARGRCARVVD